MYSIIPIPSFFFLTAPLKFSVTGIISKSSQINGPGNTSSNIPDTTTFNFLIANILAVGVLS